MANYVSDTHNGDHLYFLWGDEVDALVMFAACIGHDATQLIQRNPSCWAHYLITADTMAEAIVQGAELTDRYGPAEWMNRREGNHAFVAKIQELRIWKAAGN